MRGGGRVAYPNGVEPVPNPPPGVRLMPTTERLTRRRSKNSISLSNRRDRQGSDHSRSTSPAASRLTGSPKRIGHLMSSILASSPCKWLSMSRALMVKEDRTFRSWEGPKEAGADHLRDLNLHGQRGTLLRENYPASAEACSSHSENFRLSVSAFPHWNPISAACRSSAWALPSSQKW
jgi:hypothetical protein